MLKQLQHKFFKQNVAKLALMIQKEICPRPFLLYLGKHWRAASISFDRFLCAPFSSFLTILIIALALILPTGLRLFLQNMRSLPLERGTEISLYLKTDITDTQIVELVSRLNGNPYVAKTEYISPQKGLDTLQAVLHSNALLSELKDNPLPGVIVVTPKSELNSPQILNRLYTELQGIALIESVQLDRAWVERLHYLLNFLNRFVIMLFALFGAGLVLIMGHTIRLTMNDTHKEIVVLKLVGASDGFVKRPFLYAGFYYGLFGGILAWFMITLILIFLRAPLRALAASYGSNIVIQGLDLNGVLLLLGVSISLGISGAWLGVTKRLKSNL